MAGQSCWKPGAARTQAGHDWHQANMCCQSGDLPGLLARLACLTTTLSAVFTRQAGRTLPLTFQTTLLHSGCCPSMSQTHGHGCWSQTHSLSCHWHSWNDKLLVKTICNTSSTQLAQSLFPLQFCCTNAPHQQEYRNHAHAPTAAPVSCN